MDKIDNFSTAATGAVIKAKDTGRMCYVYPTEAGGYFLSYDEGDGWLFLAYPSGRRELSSAGAALADKVSLR